MNIIKQILANRLAQMAAVALLSIAIVGGYGYWQRLAITAELNTTIEALENQANAKTESREQYIKEDREAENAIKNSIEDGSVKSFVDYWNSSN